jgi:hypothetical protein
MEPLPAGTYSRCSTPVATTKLESVADRDIRVQAVVAATLAPIQRQAFARLGSPAQPPPLLVTTSHKLETAGGGRYRHRQADPFKFVSIPSWCAGQGQEASPSRG